MSVQSRFAPSPTGHLQLGNIRTALICYTYVRRAGGRFMLRIDDTDAERSRDEYTDSIKRDLAWLGVTWDDYRHQKGREAVYDAARDKLIAAGRLYPCYETEEELALKRKSQLGRGLPPIYDRGALSLSDEQKKKYEAEGRKPHYRFLLKHEPIVWDDLIRGRVEFHGKDMSDPVLIREDGTALYHLGSVVDDVEYGMNVIMRGEDHVTNTACHIQMFQALGATPPQFGHLPLVFDEEGKKLSKRIGSLSVAALRDEEGFEAVTLLAYLTRLGTSQPIEPFATIDDVIKNFDIKTFSRSNPRFSFEDMQRLNAKIVHHLNFADVKPRLNDMGLSAMTEEFWLAARPNLVVLRDVLEWWRVAQGPITPVIADADFANTAADLLPTGAWNADTWNIWVSAVKEKTSRKGKDLFMPLRLALTGMEHGPELAHLLPLIGYDRARARMQGQAK
jgi:glutamyl-tRNA synthetase